MTLGEIDEGDWAVASAMVYLRILAEAQPERSGRIKALVKKLGSLREALIREQ